MTRKNIKIIPQTKFIQDRVDEIQSIHRQLKVNEETLDYEFRVFSKSKTYQYHLFNSLKSINKMLIEPSDINFNEDSYELALFSISTFAIDQMEASLQQASIDKNQAISNLIEYGKRLNQGIKNTEQHISSIKKNSELNDSISINEDKENTNEEKLITNFLTLVKRIEGIEFDNQNITEISKIRKRIATNISNLVNLCKDLNEKGFDNPTIKFWSEFQNTKIISRTRRKRTENYVGLLMKDAIKKAMKEKGNSPISPQELSKIIFNEVTLSENPEKYSKNIAATLNKHSEGKPEPFFKSSGKGKWEISNNFESKVGEK